MAKKSPKKKSNAPKAHKPVLERFDLKDVRLVASQSLLNLTAGHLPKGTAINTRVDTSASPADKTLKANVSCEVISKYAGSPEPAIVIECTFQAIYGCKTARFPSPKVFERDSNMIAQTAIYNTWPFIRHYVYWTSTQMGLPALTLPLYFHTEGKPANAITKQKKSASK